MITREQWNAYGRMEQVLIEATLRSLTVTVQLGENVYTLNELRLMRFNVFAVVDHRYVVLWNGIPMSDTLYHRLSVQAMYTALDLGCYARDVAIVVSKRSKRRKPSSVSLTLPTWQRLGDDDTTENDT